MTAFRKRDGGVIEVDADDPLTPEEVRALCEETEDPAQRVLLEQIVNLVEAIKNQPRPAPVTVAAAKDWKMAQIEITGWDDRGRIKSMTMTKMS